MTAVVLLIGAAAVAAALSGDYSGNGKGFQVTWTVGRGHVYSLQVICHRGATTVFSTGTSPKITHDSWSYSGPGRSSTHAGTVHMKITGKFTDAGNKAKGTAKTQGACPEGSYRAAKVAP